MGIVEIGIISIGLAMDAFAVSICKGLSMKNMNWKKAVKIASYFGFFQAMMPVIGFCIGTHFSQLVENVDHWIACALLSCIGIHMIKEAYEENETQNDSVDDKTMTILAIATSIDALAVGITLAVLEVNMALAVGVIGVTAFELSLIGVKIGNRFGNTYEKIAQIIGGVILILIGFKIVIEHVNL